MKQQHSESQELTNDDEGKNREESISNKTNQF